MDGVRCVAHHVERHLHSIFLNIGDASSDAILQIVFVLPVFPQVPRDLKVLVASELPPMEQSQQGSAFANSVFYEEGTKTLHLHVRRLQASPGDFIVCLVHSVAHLSVRFMGNDKDQRFVSEFYRLLKRVLQQYHVASTEGPAAAVASGDTARRVARRARMHSVAPSAVFDGSSMTLGVPSTPLYGTSPKAGALALSPVGGSSQDRRSSAGSVQPLSDNPENAAVQEVARDLDASMHLEMMNMKRMLQMSMSGEQLEYGETSTAADRLRELENKRKQRNAPGSGAGSAHKRVQFRTWPFLLLFPLSLSLSLSFFCCPTC